MACPGLMEYCPDGALTSIQPYDLRLRHMEHVKHVLTVFFLCSTFFDLAYIQFRRLQLRSVTVCLGLLCAVLLAGNIGQMIFCKWFAYPHYK